MTELEKLVQTWEKHKPTGTPHEHIWNGFINDAKAALEREKTKYPIKKFDEIYHEDSDGYWEKRKFDENGNLIYFENSDGNWYKTQYDENGNQIYLEDSDGYWWKQEYDENGNLIYHWCKQKYDNEIYFEDSDEKKS